MKLVWKIVNVKIKSSLRKSKCSSNILTREEIKTVKNQGTRHSNSRHPVSISVPRHFGILQPHQQQRDLLQFMKSRSLSKSIWVNKEKDHILITRNCLKSWKISHKFSHFSEFQKIVLSRDKNQCSLKETLNVSLKLGIPFENLNINVTT